jgi:hypothetical protein
MCCDLAAQYQSACSFVDNASLAGTCYELFLDHWQLLLNGLFWC